MNSVEDKILIFLIKILVISYINLMSFLLLLESREKWLPKKRNLLTAYVHFVKIPFLWHQKLSNIWDDGQGAVKGLISHTLDKKKPEVIFKDIYGGFNSKATFNNQHGGPHEQI